MFIDSRAGVVSPIWFVLARVLSSENNSIIAKLTIWVWCGVAAIDGRIVCICVYRRLLTNHLHGKAAEICLTNS